MKVIRGDDIVKRNPHKLVNQVISGIILENRGFALDRYDSAVEGDMYYHSISIGKANVCIPFEIPLPPPGEIKEIDIQTRTDGITG